MRIAETPLQSEGRTPLAAPRGLGALTRRASLTAGAAVLDYAARLGVGFLITPILLGGLGTALFGTWEVLRRLGTYLTAADGRSTDALRLVVAQGQAAGDERAGQRYVGAAMLVWLILLPLIVAVAGSLVWLAPSLTQAPAALWDEVRLTSALLMVAFLLTTLAGLPEGVLRGVNLGYKRMGLQAGLAVVGGALMAGAIWIGLGITGLGAALVVQAAATGICFWLLTRRFVPWFGAARPRAGDLRLMLRMSLWLALGDALAKVLRGSDVVILGAVLAPTAVTPYVLTAYAAHAADGIHGLATGAAMPGVGGLLGSGQRERAARARGELQLLTWLFVTVVGTAILLWNRSLLGLWVGADRYAGMWVDLLIVLIGTASAFVRVDAFFLDASLFPKGRVLVMGLAGAVTVGLGIAFTHWWGLPGLCAGILAGRGVQLVGYPLMVRSRLDPRASSGVGRAGGMWLCLVTMVLWVAAMAAAPHTEPGGWLVWLAGVSSSVAVATALVLGLAPGEARRALIRRLRSIGAQRE